MGYVRIIFLSFSGTLLVIDLQYKLRNVEHLQTIFAGTQLYIIHFSHQLLDNGTIYQLLHATHFGLKRLNI